MPLTDTAIRNAKAQAKQYKIYDEKGLYLLINKAGKYFRYDYRYGGKRKTLALGVYPNVKLAEAREKRDEARKLIVNGIDPAHQRRIKKAFQTALSGNNFEAVTREWFNIKSAGWAKSHSSKIIRRFEIYIFPWIGSQPIPEISTPELHSVLRRIEGQGFHETAHRAHQYCGQVFRYAIATGLADRDPAADLKGALTPATHRRMATISRHGYYKGSL